MADNTCKPGVSVSFGAVGSKTVASVCGFDFPFPTIPFPPAFNLPFTFPPKLPTIKFALKLTCNPRDPIDITAGIAYGGGRISCRDAAPSEQDA